MKAPGLVTVLTFITLFAGMETAEALRVKEFDATDSTEVRFDQNLVFRCRSRVKTAHLGFDKFRIATDEGQFPRGTFVRGRVMTDPVTGTVVTIDADRISARRIEKIERKGRLDLVPDEIRIDLGNGYGRRRVLFDRSGKNRKVVTFVADLPNLPDLSDLAYEPGERYVVQVGERAQEGKGKRNRFGFTVVDTDDARPFTGWSGAGPPRVIYLEPGGGRVLPGTDATIKMRFSHPLDPRTVTPENIALTIGVAGSPRIPITTRLQQTALGTVEVEVIPEQTLPPGHSVQLVVTSRVLDLSGEPLSPFVDSWAVPSVPVPVEDVIESFDTNSNEDSEATTASWNGTEPGALVSAGAGSKAVSHWFGQTIATPNYDLPVVDLDPHGGTIRISVQGAREDVTRPGPQHVEPEADPDGTHSSPWLSADEIDLLDDYQYIRFRVEFTLPPGWAPEDPLPVVRSIWIPVLGYPD